MFAGQPSSTRLIATLALAGLASGVALVGVHLLTAPRIERNQAAALRTAITRVLPGTARIAGLVEREGQLTAAADAGRGRSEAPVVYVAFGARDERLGYAIPAEGPGFMDTIRLLYGFDPERRVIVGLEVLDSRETPGLGDKIITDEAFHDNFRALVVEPSIVALRRGGRTQPNEVDCITGATISSEAVVAILNRSAQRWLPLLEREVPAEVPTDGAIASAQR